MRCRARCRRACCAQGQPDREHHHCKAGAQRWLQLPAYAVSKAAIIKLTENVTAETRRTGVQVFSVDPGLLPIRLSTSAIAAADLGQLRRSQDTDGPGRSRTPGCMLGKRAAVAADLQLGDR
jgi:NAD(P)-dependent dehydrogenase (short-subunit alcohol dehydrogenase family)